MKTCKKCGTALAFKKLANGRWLPTNVDGSDHFDLCSKIRTKRLIEAHENCGMKPPEGYYMTDREIANFAKPADMTQPWFVGKVPWNDYAPSHCGCGNEYDVTERDCTVTLACVPCKRVRIESSYVI